MKRAEDLLDQADHLATFDSRRPRQVNLRRSVSASYSALFHLLTSEAAALHAVESELAARIARTHNHGEMKKVSTLVANDRLPRSIQPPHGGHAAPADLKTVAIAFVELQEARHEADYDGTRFYRREEVLTFARQARQAFADWDRARKTDAARVYLACFLLWKRWDEEAR